MNILKVWVRDHYYDFEDESLLSLLREWSEQLREENQSLQKIVSKLIVTCESVFVLFIFLISEDTRTR